MLPDDPIFTHQIIGPLSEAIHHAKTTAKDIPNLWKGFNLGVDVRGEFYQHVVRTKSAATKLNLRVFSYKDKSSVHSFLTRKLNQNGEEDAIVHIPNEANFCWSRFALCKELCHLLTDTESELYCGDVLSQLQIASYRPGFGGETTRIGQDFLKVDLQSEHFCYFYALELSIPWDVRKALGPDPFQDESYGDVAKKFRVPEAVIEHACMSGYFELSHQENLMLDKHGSAYIFGESH